MVNGGRTDGQSDDIMQFFFFDYFFRSDFFQTIGDFTKTVLFQTRLYPRVTATFHSLTATFSELTSAGPKDPWRKFPVRPPLFTDLRRLFPIPRRLFKPLPNFSKSSGTFSRPIATFSWVLQHLLLGCYPIPVMHYSHRKSVDFTPGLFKEPFK